MSQEKKALSSSKVIAKAQTIVAKTSFVSKELKSSFVVKQGKEGISIGKK